MLKHIVLWKLHNEASGKPKQENAKLIKQELEALRGKIKGLLAIEVGIHIPDSESSDDDADIVLYTEFEDREALEHYYRHPDHVALKPLVKEARSDRRVINYEV
jgi:hypothetical protein